MVGCASRWPMPRRCAGAPIDREELCLHRKLIPQSVFEHCMALLDQFEEKSGFTAFYQAHEDMYREVIRHFMADYERYRPHGFLAEYVGDAAGCFQINLMLGVTNANYGCTAGNHPPVLMKKDRNDASGLFLSAGANRAKAVVCLSGRGENAVCSAVCGA